MLLLATAVAALVLWLARSGASPERAAGRAAEPEAREASGGVAAPPEPGAPAALPEAVERYLAATVYPPTSGRLEASAVDLLEPDRRYERRKPVPGAPGADPPVSFLWTADKYRYSSDEVVYARFEAVSGELPAEVHALVATAQPEGRAGAEGAATALRFRAEGDAFVADLDLSRDLADHHGPVALLARYDVADAGPQEETIRIFVTPVQRIPARFSGSFQDRMSDGSLVVDVGILVDEPGFYRVDANLFAADEPVAWATFKGELGRSDGTLPLAFFGKTLRDAGKPGPYELRQLRGYLFRDGRFPDRLELRDFPGVFATRAWSLAEFSDEEWDGEHRRRMVELLLEDEQRGVSLDVPPEAAPR